MTNPLSPVPNSSTPYYYAKTKPYFSPDSSPIVSPNSSTPYYYAKTKPYFSPDSSPIVSPDSNPLKPRISSPVDSQKTGPELLKNVKAGIMNNLKDAYKGFIFNEYVFDALYDDASRRNEWVFRSNGLTAPNLYIGPGKVYIEDGLISKQGGENRVSSIIEVSLTQNIPNESRVIKIPLKRIYVGPSPYLPEANVMEEIRKKGANSIRRLDAIVKEHIVKIDNKSYYCGIFNKCAKDFSDLDPAEFSPLLLWRLVDIARAIKDLHANGYVHNDLKDENFLFNGYDNVAKLTDFGCMKKIQEDNKEHHTSASPFFADPLIWKNWRAQLEQTGNQRHPACDIRSFGKWLLYAFVHKKLDAMGKSILSEEFGKIVADIKLKIIPNNKSFNLSSDYQALDDLDNNNPGRVIFYRKDPMSQIVHTFHFLVLNDSFQLTLNWIGLLKDQMSDNEFKALHSIAELACKMQLPNPDELPSMDQIVVSLSQIAGDPENDLAGTPYKNKLIKRVSPVVLEGSPLHKKKKVEDLPVLDYLLRDYLLPVRRKLF